MACGWNPCGSHGIEITLKPGDLIYSGTPAGVGPVKAGDKLEGHVDGVGDLMVTYVK